MSSPKVEKLTTRERQVLILVASSKTTKEIAEELNLSPRTVENHRESVRKKLDLRDAAAFTRFAIKYNLIRL